MLPDKVGSEAVLAAFAKARERFADCKPHFLSLGPLRVRVEAGQQILAHWLSPALSQTLSEKAGPEDADIRMCIAIGKEVEDMKTLCAWMGSGLRRGIYETLEQPEGTLLFEHSSQFWAFWSPRRREAFVWIADLDYLAPWEKAAPLKALFHWMCIDNGLQLIHGGGVGREDGGVLLAGPGGSGKSTTALACIGSGLDYLADDYCVVDPGPGAMAYQLYTTAKLRPENLHRFENIRSRFVWQPQQEGAKPTMFWNEEWSNRRIARFPLRAIVLPKVSGMKETSWARSSAGEAWRAIAPSTIWQLPACMQKTFANVTTLSRSLPAYELRVGTRLEGIPDAIEEILIEASRLVERR